MLLLQVKIWFQNRRTKWKKHENITATDVNDQKLQNEKNPDVTKAIQNAAKLKKAKERSEQSNQGAISSKLPTDTNQLPETLQKFSIPRYAADDTNELPLCLVQEKTVNTIERIDKEVNDNFVKRELPDDTTKQNTNHDYELIRQAYKSRELEHDTQPEDLSANSIEMKVDVS